MTDNAPKKKLNLVKAFENPEFLRSPEARPIRVLCEFTEPEERFARLDIEDTLVFFGSARTLPREVAEERLEAASKELDKAGAEDDGVRVKYEQAQHDLIMTKYYEDASLLAQKLTEWSMSLPEKSRRFIICTGGGPGIMEAASRGADRAGGLAIGLNISLPMEQYPNPYLSEGLCFDFHYFFVRKFWFLHLAKALVAFPGGFGTFDELFELLTLVQTGKAERKVPILVYGTDYWKEVVNFEAMARWGVIDEEDLDLFKFCDDVDEAFEYLKAKLTELYM